MTVKYFTLITLIFAGTLAAAQDARALAEEAIHKGEYRQALLYLDQIDRLDEDSELLQLRGELYYEINELYDAIRDLTKARKAGNNDPWLFFLMARIKHNQGKYDEASFFYKEFIKLSKDKTLNNAALLELKNCAFANTAISQRENLLVQSFGDELNTILDEFKVIQSPGRGNLFYFTRDDRSGRSPQLISIYLDSTAVWKLSESRQENFQSDFAVLHDVTGENHAEFLYSSRDNKNAVKLSFLQKDSSISVPLNHPVFNQMRDIVRVDSTGLYFSALLPEGYGGYDLYKMKYENGVWSDPVNLGSRINSAFDERSPFGSADGRLLFFSSNRPYGYGGYDIYEASGGELETVRHLNNNINSAADELGFRLQHDGRMVYFYSDRKSGEGGFDLYFAYLSKAYPFYFEDSITSAYVRDFIYKASNESRLTGKSENIVVETSTNGQSEVISSAVLYYQDSADLLNEENRQKLTGLSNCFAENPGSRIQILVYTDGDEPGLPEYKQYNTLKRGIKVSEILADNGIPSSNIQLESYSDNFPVVRKKFYDKDEKLSMLNRRVELAVVGSPVWVEDFVGQYINRVPAYAYDRRYELFRGIREELYYSIHIGSSERIFKNSALRLYEDVYIRKEHLNAPNDYYVGLFIDPGEARQVMNGLNKIPGIQAKLKAFYNGRLLQEEDLKDMGLDSAEEMHGLRIISN